MDIDFVNIGVGSFFVCIIESEVLTTSIICFNVIMFWGVRLGVVVVV